MPQISLLDCTLRDGGFINGWRFGEVTIRGIFHHLTNAGIDVVEVGFLNAQAALDNNCTLLPNTSAVKKLFGHIPRKRALVVAMIDYGTCPLASIEPAANSFLDGIRVIFKKARMKEALAFCRALQALGYLVFVQPVSITDYTPDELNALLTLVGDLRPHAVSIVDTYGLLAPHEVLAYFHAFHRALPLEITVGYHAHNNLQLGFAACQALAQEAAMHAPLRQLLFDATLFGMGKSAGNTPLELLTLFENKRLPKRYDLGELLAALEAFVLPLCHAPSWGYQLPYFMAAAARVHPSYVLFLQNEAGLDAKTAFDLLQEIPQEKKLYFDRELADALCHKKGIAAAPHLR